MGTMSRVTKEVLSLLNEATASLVIGDIKTDDRMAHYAQAREHLAHALLALDNEMTLSGCGMVQQGFCWSAKNERCVKQASSGVFARADTCA